MKVIISNQSELPIYAQIREQIKEQILNGQIEEGTILPSIRKLAKEVGVSVITTTRAYNDLEKEEKELEELINTMTIPKQSYEDNDDLLLDLKGDDNTIITKPVKADFDEVTASDLTRNNIDKTSNSSKLDKTFYTDSNMFTKNDFEDFSTISKELNRKRSPLKVIILIIVLLILVALGYFTVTKYILK